MWDFTRYAVEFFQEHLPFVEMQAEDESASNPAAYCFAKKGEIYAVYLGEGGTTDLSIPNGTYSVEWYDPRNGGSLQAGSKERLKGPGAVSIGLPPAEEERDWVALIRMVEE